MRRNSIILIRHKNASIGCVGQSGWWYKLNTTRSCDNCPIRFKCLTCNDVCELDNEEEYDNAVDFIQGR